MCKNLAPRSVYVRTHRHTRMEAYAHAYIYIYIYICVCVCVCVCDYVSERNVILEFEFPQCRIPLAPVLPPYARNSWDNPKTIYNPRSFPFVQERKRACMLTDFLIPTNALLYTIIFLFFYWRYNPLWILAFSVIFFHSALSLHNFLHPLISIICISSSLFLIHLFLLLPLFLLPVGFQSSTLLGILLPSIRITWLPIQ